VGRRSNNGNGVLNELPPVADLKKVLEAAGVSDDSRVILYGDASVLPATRAYFTLDYLGHGDQAALLDGGLEKWRAEGRTLSKEATIAAAGHFTPHPKPELVVQIDEVKQLSGKPASAHSAVLLDARPATDFRGEKGEHIPGAVNQSGWRIKPPARPAKLGCDCPLSMQSSALPGQIGGDLLP
jgi:thiosulfate/3-mercaptopyruvate sulfurtransferase